MSFGYSVGDFVAIGTLAWTVYKSCKEAPESFGNISSELLSLQAVLKEAEETVFARPLSQTKQERLKAVGDGCYSVLKDLENLVEKYESLGSQAKRTWDRMRWGTEDIADLRARLTSNIGLLAAFVSVSQVNVEKKLDNILQEFREGKREGSVISTQTTDSLCMNEKDVWRAIRKELEDIGITVTAFDANKEFIFEWFAKAVASGAFEEQLLDDSPNAKPHEDPSPELSKVEEIGSRGPPGLEARQFETAVPQVVTSSPPDISTSNSGSMLSRKDEIGNGPSTPLPPKIAVKRPRIPRVASLIASLSRPNKSLINAIRYFDISKACEILNNENKVVWLDSASFRMALTTAASNGQAEVVQLLIEKSVDINVNDGGVFDSALVIAIRDGHGSIVRLLLENGADVNARDIYGKTALMLASEARRPWLAQLLFDYGDVDVNATGHDGTALEMASKRGYQEMVQLLLKNGAQSTTRFS